MGMMMINSVQRYRDFQIPFCFEDQEITRSELANPTLVEWTALRGCQQGDHIQIEIPCEKMELMGPGPWMIFEQAAESNATIQWDFDEVELPPVVERFYKLLFRDLELKELPRFSMDVARHLFIVGGRTLKR